ncbi:uroporphyrinogen-III synthase [Myroides sp. LJL115]
MISPTILSTKILSPENRSLLENSSLQWIEEDFICTQNIDFDLKEVYDFLLFTSQNAVRSVLANKGQSFFIGKKAFCVGINTKGMLEALGCDVLAWAHYAKDLAPTLQRDFSLCRISFFTGNIRSEVLPTAFKSYGMIYQEINVYHTKASGKIIPSLFQGVCFYSPSAVYSYLQHNTLEDKVCFSIGNTTSEALKKYTSNIELAQYPTIEATIKACIRYYQ